MFFDLVEEYGRGKGGAKAGHGQGTGPARTKTEKTENENSTIYENKDKQLSHAYSTLSRDDNHDGMGVWRIRYGG